jgi:DNA-binding transcriptional ArsR family regulator
MADPHADIPDFLTGPAESGAGPSAAQLQAAAGTFELLSNSVRLHLVYLAAQGVHDVGTLAAHAGVAITTASQHLNKLRLAGLVTPHRQGRRHIYTVEDVHVVTMVEQIFSHIAPDGTLAPDPPSGTSR